MLDRLFRFLDSLFPPAPELAWEGCPVNSEPKPSRDWRELITKPLSFFGFGCCCGCACEPGTSFQVDVAGVANLGAFCVGCTVFNGTYFLTKTATDCRGSAISCLWEYSNLTMTDPCGRSLCGHPDGICIRLIQTTNGTPASVCTVEVQAKGFALGFGDCGFNKGDPPNGVYVKTFSGIATCSDYSSTNIPYDHAESTAVNCDFTASTVTVTAIP